MQVVQEAEGKEEGGGEGEGEREEEGKEGQERPTMKQSKTYHLCFSLLHILVTLLT